MMFIRQIPVLILNMINPDNAVHGLCIDVDFKKMPV